VAPRVTRGRARRVAGCLPGHRGQYTGSGRCSSTPQPNAASGDSSCRHFSCCVCVHPGPSTAQFGVWYEMPPSCTFAVGQAIAARSQRWANDNVFSTLDVYPHHRVPTSAGISSKVGSVRRMAEARSINCSTSLFAARVRVGGQERSARSRSQHGGCCRRRWSSPANRQRVQTADRCFGAIIPTSEC